MEGVDPVAKQRSIALIHDDWEYFPKYPRNATIFSFPICTRKREEQLPLTEGELVPAMGCHSKRIAPNHVHDTSRVGAHGGPTATGRAQRIPAENTSLPSADL